MRRLTQDGTVEPVSRDQILRREREQGNIHFSCSADHGQDWKPYPVDPYSAIGADYTDIYIHTHSDRLRAERHLGVWHSGGLESDGVKG